MTTAKVLNFLKGGDWTDCGRYSRRCVDEYTVVFHQAIESSRKMVARYKDGKIEVPQYGMENGFGTSKWGGNWYEVTEKEFLKDLGRSFVLNQGVVNYSA